MVARLAFTFDTLPASGDIGIHVATTTGLGLAYRASTGTISAGSASGWNDGPVITTGRWYVVDWSIERNTAIGTRYWLRVDGVDFGFITNAGVSAAISGFDIGLRDSTTADLYIDDLAVSGTAGDYPIGDGTIRALYPTADGTHSYNAGTDFQDGSGAGSALATPASSEVDTWQSLANPLPASVQTNFVGGIGAGTAEYLEHQPSDLSDDVSAINGVALKMAYHSVNTTANNHRARLTDGGVTNIVDLINGTINASNGATLACVTTEPRTTDAAAAAWTKTNLNAARLRFNPQDVNPDAFLDGYCLEVDYVPVAVLPRGVAQQNQIRPQLWTPTPVAQGFARGV